MKLEVVVTFKNGNVFNLSKFNYSYPNDMIEAWNLIRASISTLELMTKVIKIEIKEYQSWVTLK